MKKIILLIMYLFTTLLIASTITLDNLGIVKQGGIPTDLVVEGDYIEIKADITITNYTEEGEMYQVGVLAISPRVSLYWYKGIDGEGGVSDTPITNGDVISGITVFGYTSNLSGSYLVRLTLPTPPSDANSFQIYAKAIGEDESGPVESVNTIYSNESPMSGYGTYLNLDNRTITIHSIGLKSSSGIPNKLQESIMINGSINYSTFNNHYFNYLHADEDIGINGKVWIDKFITLTPSVNGYDSSVKVSVESDWNSQGQGIDKYYWFNIMCPDMTGIKSIQLRFGCYESDSSYGQQHSSYVEILSDPISPNDPEIGYYRYLYDVWEETIVGNKPALVPGIGIEIKTGGGILLGVPVWNEAFITFDGSNYADVSTFVPFVVLGSSVFSISFWKKTSNDGTVIGSFDGTNYFEIKVIK